MRVEGGRDFGKGGNWILWLQKCIMNNFCATVLKMVCIGRCAESTANFLGIAEVG